MRKNIFNRSGRKKLKQLTLIAMIIALAVTPLAACKHTDEDTNKTTSNTTSMQENSDTSTTTSESTEQTTEATTTEAEPQEEMKVNLYYIKETTVNGGQGVQDNQADGEKSYYLVRETHTIPKTEAVAKAALEELLKNDAQTEGAFVSFREDQRIIGVDIENGVATVNLSPEYLLQEQSGNAETYSILAMVNTLTEFPSIEEVKFLVDGEEAQVGGLAGIKVPEKLVRNLSLVLEPEIWINTPEDGAVLSGNKIRIEGSAMVFEKTLHYKLEDKDGNVLVEDFLTMSEGSDMRGIFDFEIEVPETDASEFKLSLYGASGKDGSPTGLVTHTFTIK